MDQDVRNILRNVVTQCRQLLEVATAETLQGHFGIYTSGRGGDIEIEDDSRMGHLSEEDLASRTDLRDHLRHIEARDLKPTEALDQLVREISFTHLNRLCAYKMMEARGLIREAVSRGMDSQGFFFYLADHPNDETAHGAGQQDLAYRHYLDWLGGELSQEIGVLFDPNDSANRVYPPQRVLDEVLALVNSAGLASIWTEDETIGWVYQYFTPKELRDRARKESQAPRNSHELAFRNQFYTPRYVVEFLTDNTLGRAWYEMRKGDTQLKERCQYLIRRPTEVFLDEGEDRPVEDAVTDAVSQEELLRRPEHIPHRKKQDPREIRILDPACGSGHFLLYCFDLLEVIYEEAYHDPDLGPRLREAYPTLDGLRRAQPGLILEHNLHGIDIDVRATQIAALALWLRCQRAYGDLSLATDARPKITRTNVVSAEPMPGDTDMLAEFTSTMQPAVLGQLVKTVFEKMELAGELGSLLKIEDEIRSAVAGAKAEYEQHVRHVQDGAGYLPSLAPPRERTLFDFNDMTDGGFLGKAEEQILAALDAYASHSRDGDGLRRTLFAGDAARGFAFIDMCFRRFDIVLMNPPFGDLTRGTRRYVQSIYPDAYNDIYCAFISYGHSVLRPAGLLGAITPRSAFFLSQMSRFRHAVLLGRARPHVLADLGEKVLDEAMNETACYVISDQRVSRRPCIFLRTVAAEDKAAEISRGVEALATGIASVNTYLQDLSTFAVLPDSPMVYWVRSSILAKLAHSSSFEPTHGFVRQGIATTDDMRFVRLASEVPARSVLSPPNFPNSANDAFSALQSRIVDLSRSGRWWAFHVKGEASQPWYAPPLCMVDWSDNGAAIKEQREARGQHAAPSEQHYFRPGLSWARRSVRFTPYVVPAGAIPSASRYQAFPSDGAEMAALAVLASSVASAFVRFYGEKFVWPNYLVSNVRSTPFPHDLGMLAGEVGQACKDQVVLRREAYRNFEPFHEFTVPWLVHAYASPDGLKFDRRRLMPEEHEIAVARTLDLTVGELSEVRHDVDEALAHQRDSVDRTADPGDATIALDYGLRSLHESLISYCIGVTVGRWDVRLGLDPPAAPVQRDVFAPLPACPPGMLVAADGLPADRSDVPPNYPVEIGWDGILADDPGHARDIVRCVSDVLDVLYPDQHDSVRGRACTALEVPGLREYVRRSGPGGLWADHVSRYSRSRRKAPIYWYLRSSKGNYGLWFYYHRLGKDMFYQALQNYVEPKIQLEEARLSSLTSQRTEVSSAGRAAKQAERELDRQERFILELYDFRDKLRRAADLRIDPDINDGVVLNIAPLWELVPWKEAKKYWDALETGKYDWSHIAYQLWPERVKELCKTDRSIAIAHGREDLWQGNS